MHRVVLCIIKAKVYLGITLLQSSGFARQQNKDMQMPNTSLGKCIQKAEVASLEIPEKRTNGIAKRQIKDTLVPRKH